jgi:hypothetical protein
MKKDVVGEKTVGLPYDRRKCWRLLGACLDIDYAEEFGCGNGLMAKVF